jgi:hypothetical protein
MVQTSISLSKWVLDEINKTPTNNKSKRIEELIIKGLMYEQRKYFEK